MNHPIYCEYVAEIRMKEFHREAEQYRAARQLRPAVSIITRIRTGARQWDNTARQFHPGRPLATVAIAAAAVLVLVLRLALLDGGGSPDPARSESGQIPASAPPEVVPPVTAPSATSLTPSTSLPQATASAPFTIGQFVEIDVPEGTSTQRDFITGAASAGSIELSRLSSLSPSELQSLPLPTRK